MGISSFGLRSAVGLGWQSDRLGIKGVLVEDLSTAEMLCCVHEQPRKKGNRSDKTEKMLTGM